MHKKSRRVVDDKGWGRKFMAGSSFQLFARRYIDSYINDIPEGDYKNYASLAGAALKMALLDAENEVNKNPDALGPYQAAIFSKPTDDFIGTYCKGIGLDPEFFRLKVSDYLDIIADQARQKKARTSNVVCITEARVRKQTQEIQIVSKPVLSRRRVIGDQYGWTF